MKFIILPVLLFLTCCSNNQNSNVLAETSLSDTITFQVHDDESVDWILFDFVKNGQYKKVYKFQELFEDEFGFNVWRDFWLIDDFSENEFLEMKKYANYQAYYEKVLHGSNDNRKYQWKKI